MQANESGHRNWIKWRHLDDTTEQLPQAPLVLVRCPLLRKVKARPGIAPAREPKALVQEGFSTFVRLVPT
jgi:hypothetical protein